MGKSIPINSKEHTEKDNKSEDASSKLEVKPSATGMNSSKEDFPRSTKSNRVALGFKIFPVCIEEEKLGNFLFEYLLTVSGWIKNHFLSLSSQFKIGMADFLAQFYYKIVKQTSKEMVGFLAFGIKSPQEITILHLSTSEEETFSNVLKDAIVALFQDFCLVDRISIALRYTQEPEFRNSKGEEKEKRSAWYIDPMLRKELKDIGFRNKSVHVDLMQRRTAYFVITRKELLVKLKTTVKERKITSDPRAVNVRLNISILFSSQSSAESLLSPSKSKKLEEDLKVSLDMRSVLIVALFSYACLFSKWCQTAFTLPYNCITLEDLNACKKDNVKLTGMQVVSHHAVHRNDKHL